METPEQYTDQESEIINLAIITHSAHNMKNLLSQYSELKNAELIKCLKIIDECLKDGITIEKNDPIHNVIKKLLKP